MNWTPNEEKTERWVPKGGWNPIWSEQEKIKAIHLFFFFTRQKRYPPAQAEVLLQMVLWKSKYPTLRYAPSQEQQLKEALRPIIRLEATSSPTW